MGKLAYIEIARQNGYGVCLVANQWRYPKPGIDYFLDNGAYSCWTQNLPFDNKKFCQSLDKLESVNRGPDFIVCPDIVAEGYRSLDFSLSWLNRIPAAYNVYLAVQDGMEAGVIADHLSLFDGVFVGGTIEWKLSTMGDWADLAHSHDLKCHVGRIGTFRRLLMAKACGVDSIDSSTFVQKDKTGKYGQYAGFMKLRAFENQTSFETQYR